MRSLTLAIVAVLASACSSTHAGTAPTPVKVVTDMDYNINIPDPHTFTSLVGAFGARVPIAPLDAQRQWDFTATYGGSPNVYFGDTAPHCGQYTQTGIVVAPRAVAGMAQFTAADWPTLTGLEPGVTYRWVGLFVYSRAAAPGTYTYDPDSLLCWHP